MRRTGDCKTDKVIKRETEMKRKGEEAEERPSKTGVHENKRIDRRTQKRKRLGWKMSCMADVFKIVSTEAFKKAPYLRNLPL